MSEAPHDATTLIAAIASGDQAAGKKLFKLLYDEIHSMAHHAMKKEEPGHILQTTALVHETYLKLIPGQSLKLQDRIHFFRMAGKAMRRILISEARKKNAAKRGSGKRPLPLDEEVAAGIRAPSAEFSLDDLEALDCSLDKLAEHESHHWMTTLVDLRFFAGLNFDQVAEMMEISKGKVMRDWEFTKAWLKDELDR